MKHTVLLWLLAAMQRKEKPVFVLDTHGGPGFVDLTGEAPGRTGKWRDGIGRLLEDPPEILVPYAEYVRGLGLYPGSPALLRSRLRPGDRMAACELHPEDHALLRRRFAGDAAVAVHHRDGYEALGALLPPIERRALVLIDPPYEQPGEFGRVLAGMNTARSKLRDAVVAAWYPIKHLAPVRAFHDGLRESGVRDAIAGELRLREPLDATRLNGCGLAILNPPFGAEAALPKLLDALLLRLGNRERGEAAMLFRIADE